MNTASSISDTESRLRALIEERASAVRAKDVDKAMSGYAADVVMFDLPPPLQSAGAQVLDKKPLSEWFASFRGPIGFEMRDLRITAGDDVAFCHSLNQISGSRASGEETDVWVRTTVCFRRMAGEWKIAHEHVLVPFYMDGSYRAAVDLKP